jgi:hypothetical protein
MPDERSLFDLLAELAYAPEPLAAGARQHEANRFDVDLSLGSGRSPLGASRWS